MEKKETVEKAQPKENKKPEVKVAPQEDKPIVDIEVTKEQKEKRDNEDELAVKLTQYNENKARTTGTYSPTLGRNLGNINKEIEQFETVIESQQIELTRDQYLNPTQQYQLDGRWRELQRKGLKDMRENNISKLNTVKKQKEKIAVEQPELKKKINQLQKTLGKELTKFE